MQPDVMIDLETLGTGEGCNILQVGAVLFDPNSGEIVSEFNRFIRDESRPMALSTALWWMQQPSAAAIAAKVEASGTTIMVAFSELCGWLGRGFAGNVWAMPAAYDLPIVKHALASIGMKTPWHYRQERCARTLIAESGIARTPAGAGTHDAVFDCRVQIADLLRARSRMAGGAA